MFNWWHIPVLFKFHGLVRFENRSNKINARPSICYCRNREIDYIGSSLESSVADTFDKSGAIDCHNCRVVRGLWVESRIATSIMRSKYNYKDLASVCVINMEFRMTITIWAIKPLITRPMYLQQLDHIYLKGGLGWFSMVCWYYTAKLRVQSTQLSYQYIRQVELGIFYLVGLLSEVVY